MPRIQIPQLDRPASRLDKVIGSDLDNASVTRNYQLGDILALFNSLSGGGVYAYKYKASLTAFNTYTGIMATLSGTTNPDSVATFRFSTKDISDVDLTTLVTNYNSNSDDVVMRLTSEEDSNLIAVYRITGVTSNATYVDVDVLQHKSFNSLTFVQDKNFTLSFDYVNVLGGNSGGVTNTSELTNDGADGVNPFITSASLVTDHTALSNIGTNTHVQIDNHIADSTLHYTQASISITESQISDLQSYLLSTDIDTFAELQAIVADATLVKSGDNISLFTNDAGYITEGDDNQTLSFVDSTGLLTISGTGNTVDLGLTTTDKSNWDTAFGWGDHALAGYITATLGNEEVQDIVGAMTTLNTETLITVTYQDADGTLDFVVENDLSLYDNTASGFLVPADIDTFAELDTIVADKPLVNLTDGGTFAADISVPDEVYGVAWDTSVEVPTKNAVYDKIETHISDLTLHLRETTNNLFGGSTAGENIVLNGGTTAFGVAAMQDGNYINNSGFGFEAGQKNTGWRINAFGLWAGKRNIGDDGNFFGQESGQFNRGDRAVGVGTETAQANIGDDVVGIGDNSAIYNEGNNNTGIGSQTLAFQSDVAGLKSFTAPDVTALTNRITITTHGFGANGTYRNLLYAGVTGGITNGKTYLFQIIDANTIELQEDSTLDLDGTEAGDLTPQTVYTNVTALGYNAQPTASNQVILGDTNVTTVITTGEITTPNVLVDDEVYGVGWDTSLEVPTKNAVYDKIEATTTSLSNYLLNTTDTFTGTLTVDGDIQFTADDKLQFSSEYAYIYEDNANGRSFGANEIIFASESDGVGFHFIEGETSEYQDVTAGAFITDGGASTQVVLGDGTLALLTSLSVGDADTLDSLDSLQFLRSDEDDDMVGIIYLKATTNNKLVVGSNNWFTMADRSGYAKFLWFADYENATDLYGRHPSINPYEITGVSTGLNFNFYTNTGDDTILGGASTIFQVLSTGVKSNAILEGNTVVKTGATSDDILLGDGTTTSLATLDADYVAIVGDTMTGQLEIEYADVTVYGATGTHAYTNNDGDKLSLQNTDTTNNTGYTSLHFQHVGSGGNAAGRMVLQNGLGGDSSFRWLLRDSAHTSYTEEKMVLDSEGNLTAVAFIGDGSSLTALDADTLDTLDSTQFLRSDVADSKTSGTLTFDDNVALNLGTSGDLNMFFGGSNSYIDINTGNLYIRDSANATIFTFAEASGNFTATGSIYAGASGNARMSDDVNGATFGKADATSRTYYQATTGQRFFTNSAETMRLNNSGYLGIGTVSPDAKLDVVSTVSYETIQMTYSKTDATTQRVGLNMQHYTAAEQPISLINAYVDASVSFVSIGGSSSANNAAEVLRFYTAGDTTTISGTERMRIDNAGLVGIGTTAPEALLHVQKDDTSYAWSNYTDNIAIFEGSTDAMITIAANTNGNSSIWFADPASQSAGRIRYEHATDDFEFWTNGAQRMKIEDTGTVLIGATANRFNLRNDGVMLWGSAAQIGTLSWSGTAAIMGGLATFNTEIWAGGSTKATILTTGEFGIGITAPISPLHIYENTTETSTGAGVTIEQDGTGDAVLQYLLTGGQRWMTGIDNTDDSYNISAGTDLNSSTALTIDDTTLEISGIDAFKKIVTDDATTTHTVTTSDRAVVRRFTSSSAITVTVDTGSLTNIGETAELDQYGTGLVTVAAGTATLRINANDTLASDGQYSRIAIQKMTSTEYRVFGQLAPA